MLAMVMLTIVKGTVGTTYHSMALVADASNSLSDILASTLILSGLRLAGRTPNERFPYGYYRGETVASLFVAIMIILSGFEIIHESINKLIAPEPIIVSVIPLLAAALSAVTYFLLSRYKLSVGKAIRSQSLIADATHSMVDVYAGIMVFIGVAFSTQGLTIIEVFVALGLGIYIIIQGGGLAKDAIMSLMDAGTSPELIIEVHEIASEIEGIVDVHDIRVRRAGPVYFADMHLVVRRDLSIDEAHELSDILEKRLRKKISDLESVTIHVEPDGRVRKKLVIPVDTADGARAHVQRHFGKTRYFCIVDLDATEVNGMHFIENPAYEAEKKKGPLALGVLSREGVTAVTVDNIGEGPLALLRGKYITVYSLPENAAVVADVVRAYREGQLLTLKTTTE
ncbi:MAG: cation diffusion facilitator family transporter [Candidatus Thorarchaeota archaeon]|nr:cation diffusion facilitator family transporter [Candidatus Thorarchaeota archaeon]